jgi:hypothetical protein
LHRCARSECECERKGGRLVVAALGLFAALGEQPAFSVGVESKCRQVLLWNMTARYQSTPLNLQLNLLRRALSESGDTDNPDRTSLEGLAE